jgi:hypothetical protein
MLLTTDTMRNLFEKKSIFQIGVPKLFMENAVNMVLIEMPTNMRVWISSSGSPVATR